MGKREIHTALTADEKRCILEGAGGYQVINKAFPGGIQSEEEVGERVKRSHQEIILPAFVRGGTGTLLTPFLRDLLT